MLRRSVFAIALLSAGCDVQVGDKGFSVDIAGGKAGDEWVRTYTLPPRGRLDIVNLNGTIEATPADGPQVEVRVERLARAQSDDAARAILQRIEMREDVSPTSVRIEANAGAASARREGGGGLGRRNAVDLRYRVRVPAGMVVSFKTDNGAIRMENLDGQLAASTINGGITGVGLSGGITVSATNGGVRLEMVSVKSDVQIALVNGGLRLDLPSDVKATLDAECVNGGISVDDRFGMQSTEVSRQKVTGTLNGGGPRISVTTVNGGIRIRARTR